MRVYYPISKLQQLITEGQIGPFERILKKDISLEEAKKLCS